QHTVEKGQLGAHEIMYKYISTLENLVPSFGTETFSVTHLQLREDGEESSSYSSVNQSDDISKDDFRAPLTHVIMEVQMNSSQEARSFISLLDGYYRLTADAHHYLCHEVAPPRVVLSEANLLHGPMHDDFVLHKLKKEAGEEGTFLVRWSALDYHRIILAVLNRNEQKGSAFCMEGWDKDFSSVKELTDNLKTYVLKSGSDNFTVRKC
ncbi:hypothetical protein GOODEAATRI_028841, partial [Goodea atripinnis]